MLFSDSHILSTILFTPLIGAILMLFIPRERADLHRWMGNIFGFLGLVVSLPLILALSIRGGRAAIPIRGKLRTGFLRSARISLWASTD